MGVEEQLYEEIEPPENFPIGDKKFKGFIDLIIKTEDGKYNIIDWKTCSWGWDSRKRTDPMVTYQLTFYKNFFAKKHNISKVYQNPTDLIENASEWDALLLLSPVSLLLEKKY